ncbi:MAG: hypothetical protein M1821_003520 [Bathelium mastoideum]|nr:MAG: hypothetical protein M1821_003520 [Bathelium mastoideum]KAI9682608.1 MAG: hypothetical protein M1822_006906 [Bathelium mastoideum]
MATNAAVPDAWDDDWESLADKQDKRPSVPSEVVKTSKAERREQHAKENKQLWDFAESSQDFHFLNAKGQPPLKGEFKPAVKVLSRKPQPKILSKSDPAVGVANLVLDEEDDSEEEARKQQAMTFAERQAKAQREREEKQRKYAEVREKIFGNTDVASSSSASRTGSPRGGSTGASQGSKSSSRRGRGRGGRERGDSQNSSADQSPSRPASRGKQLFDPTYSPKPTSIYVQKREATGSENSSRPTTPAEGQPIRAPRGPDNSGRGGFGFANRGGGLQA